jgi:exodeoxyribonuclease VII small subunit
MKSMSENIATKTFEEALKELEGLIKKFEEGQFTLDEAINAYEAGVLLKDHCLTKLQQAKAKIDIVMADKTESVE